MKVKTFFDPLHILTRSYSMDEILADNQVLFRCTGELNDADCDQHIHEAELELLKLEYEKRLHKRIFYVLMESIQNICRHKCSDPVPDNELDPTLILGKQRERHYVLTANPIPNSKIVDLKTRLDRINSTNTDELRTQYRKELMNGEHNHAGGASLGLLDIARKAGGLYQYRFEPISENLSYFILKINIEHQRD